MNIIQVSRVSMLAVALSALISPAMADGPKPAATLAPPLPSVTVHFNDLDTATAAGSKALLVRIHSAAAQVCHTTAEWYPTTWGSYRDCYRATLDRIVSKLNLPQLTSLYAQEMHRPPAEAPLQVRNHP